MTKKLNIAQKISPKLHPVRQLWSGDNLLMSIISFICYCLFDLLDLFLYNNQYLIFTFLILLNQPVGQHSSVPVILNCCRCSYVLQVYLCTGYVYSLYNIPSTQPFSGGLTGQSTLQTKSNCNFPFLQPWQTATYYLILTF